MLNSKRVTYTTGRHRRKQDKRALAESLSPVRDLSPGMTKDGMIVYRGVRGQLDPIPNYTRPTVTKTIDSTPGKTLIT